MLKSAVIENTNRKQKNLWFIASAHLNSYAFNPHSRVGSVITESIQRSAGVKQTFSFTLGLSMFFSSCGPLILAQRAHM